MAETSVLDALRHLIVELEESGRPGGEVRAHGIMRFGQALEGPPGRLHGGHHAFVRTLPVLKRLSAHDDSRTFPCSVDVSMRQGLPLEAPVPFEARYRSDQASWELTTRLENTDRLLAHARAIRDEPLIDSAEIEHWRALFAGISPEDDEFEMFGCPIHLSQKLVWLESRDPLHTLPGSQHAALVDPGGTLGPAFVSTQLDGVGATARGALMRHPHFTKHIEIRFACDRIPARTHLLCLADRSRMEEDASSGSSPVEIGGQMYGTARVPVVMLDAAFDRVFATGTVTVHPVDPTKFEALRKMRQIRRDP